jgi:aryl-alcohol dehydrogenase-like predicted oxidoreductase
VLENSNIDKVLIGIDKLEQLQNNINVLGNGIDECDIKFINSLKIKEKELLSPVNWN